MVKYLKTETFKKGIMESNKVRGLTFMLVFVLLIVGISFASAQENLGIFKQDSTVQLLQTCSICDYVTLDSIKLPNSTTLFINTNMTQSGSTFYYNFNQTDLLGEYIYNTHYGNYTAPVSFEITYTGEELTGEQTTMYAIILLFLIGILIYLIYLYPKLPQHKTNESGYVIDVAQMSYLRPVMIGVMWILVMSVTFIVANISVAYITAGFLGKFLFGIWTIMMYSNFLILPLWIIYLINDFYKTAKLKEFIERGGAEFN